MYGSKLIWFWCGDRDWLFFCAGRKWFSFKVKVDCLGFAVCGRNWLHFSVGDRTWLDFGAAIGIDLVFVKRLKTTFFSVWSQITSVFVSGHRNWLDISVGIEIDLISAIGFKSGWRRPRWPGRVSSCLLKSISWVQFSPSAHTRRDFWVQFSPSAHTHRDFFLA